MAYTVLIQGIPVTCDTAQDAVELARFASRNGSVETVERSGKAGRARRKATRQAPLKTRSNAETRKKNARSMVVAALTAIQEAGQDGIEPHRLAEVVGRDDPRTLGIVAGWINKLVRDIDMKPEHVFQRRKTPTGKRWFHTRNTAEAIERLKPQRERL